MNIVNDVSVDDAIWVDSWIGNAVCSEAVDDRLPEISTAAYSVEKPTLTFLEDGAVFNPVSIKLLGRPDHVQVYWDESKAIVRACGKDDLDAVKVENENQLQGFFSRQFYETLGWNPEHMHKAWGDAFYELGSGTYIVYNLKVCLLVSP
ncbi:MAG: hypothetical protein IIZ39_10585 [Blautia sp.]|nr:hypothetical protein [Blautia sp.]